MHGHSEINHYPIDNKWALQILELEIGTYASPICNYTNYAFFQNINNDRSLQGMETLAM